MKAITTKVSYLGTHISQSLSSIPRPDFHGHLVKDTLKSARSTLANAANQVIKAIRPDGAVLPPAHSQQPPSLQELVTLVRTIPDGATLIAFLKGSGEWRLVEAATKLEEMLEVSNDIATQLEKNPDCDCNKQILCLLGMAGTVRHALNMTGKTPSVHLEPWLDSLTQTGQALHQQRREVSFGENTNKTLHTAKSPKLNAKTISKQTTDRRAQFARSGTTTTSTAKRSKSQDISSQSSECTSDEDSVEVTERRLDFTDLAKFTSVFTSEQLCKVQESINQLLEEVNTHANIAINGKSGTPMWTFAVKKVIAATDQLSLVIGQLGNDYFQAGGSNLQLAQWLNTKLSDIRTETKAWQAKLGSVS